jgi:PAS domain S-box-containing protein
MKSERRPKKGRGASPARSRPAAHGHDLCCESEQRYRDLVERSPDAILVIGAGRYVYVNPAGAALAGAADAAAMIGRDVLENVHPDDRAVVLRRWSRAVESGSGNPWLIEKLLRYDDRVVEVEAVSSPITYQGRPAIQVILRDLTARRQMEQSLRRLNESLEQRVAQRTAEAEQRTAELRALAGEMTQAEERERRRLAQVLHDHLQQVLVAAKMRVEMARTHALTQLLRQQLTQVDELLVEAIGESRSLTAELSPPVLYDSGLTAALEWLARQMLGKHGLRVRVQAQAAAEPRSQAVRILFFTAVRELLFNIVKHAGVREARVTLARLDGQLEVQVEDAGAGFDPVAVRARRAQCEAFGLFSIQQRLELAGGGCAIDSAPGRGTRVRLSAPLGPGDAEASAPPRVSPAVAVAGGEAPAAADGKVRVLLVDDHKIVREGLAHLLATTRDIQVVGQADDGRDAVDLARTLAPDVVLMDLVMPRHNGVEATRIITAEMPKVKVVALSVHEEEDAAVMRHAGAVAYWRKDGPAEELIAIIRRCAPGGSF